MLDLSLTPIILNEVKRILPSPDQLDELGEVYKNFLFDLDGPKTLKLSTDLEVNFIITVFRFWNAILDCHNRLEHSLKFLSAFPSGKQLLNKHEYLQYHAEVYLHNAYILFERTKHFYKRCYKKTSLFNENLAVDLSNQIDAIKKNMPILLVRDNHVHSHLVYEEEILKKISSMRIISETSKDEMGRLFGLYADSEVYAAKEKLHAQFNRYQGLFEKYLESFSNTLEKSLANNGKLLIPSFN